MNKTMYPNVLSSSSICSDRVKNAAGEDLGKIEDLMIDLNSGRIAYAVLSFGGFLKMGNKLFAIPWEALKVDAVNKQFILHIDKTRLENGTGFDKDNWPNMPDARCAPQVGWRQPCSLPASESPNSRAVGRR